VVVAETDKSSSCSSLASSCFSGRAARVSLSHLRACVLFF